MLPSDEWNPKAKEPLIQLPKVVTESVPDQVQAQLLPGMGGEIKQSKWA